MEQHRQVGSAVENKAFSNWILCHYPACILLPDLMTPSCPSQTNQQRQTRCFLLQLFDPEPRGIDFPLNGMRGYEGKTERAKERKRGGWRKWRHGGKFSQERFGRDFRRVMAQESDCTVHVSMPVEHGLAWYVRRERERMLRCKRWRGRSQVTEEDGHHICDRQRLLSCDAYRAWRLKYRDSSNNSVVWTSS